MKMNGRKAVFCLSFCFWALSVFSCKQDLISEPNMKELSNSRATQGKKLDVPAEFAATQGGKREVSLTWKAVTGAARYKIFSADDEFSEMEQCADVKGTVTSVKLKEKAGALKYYSIQAVGFQNNDSAISAKAVGSTLAVPVITDIEQTPDGTKIIVSWWMDNCSIGTYKKSVMYEVTCTDDAGKTVGKPVTVSDGSQSASFVGLQSDTKYLYQVSAYIKPPQGANANDIAKETSEKMDAKTARRLRPTAPIDFKAEQGTEEKAITLTFKLPPLVDLSVDGSGRHPLYFKIWRKEKGADDSKYAPIVEYLGSVKNTDAKKRIYQFSCKKTGLQKLSDAAAVEVKAGTGPECQTVPAYPNYTSLSTLTFKDSLTVKRGAQYTYKIQSFVDGTPQVITAYQAAAVADGHLIALPSLGFKEEYKTSADGATFTEISAQFTAAFESFGVGYHFVLQETRTDTTNAAPNTLLDTPDIKKITGYKRVFKGNDLIDRAGSYQYALYVLKAGEKDVKKAYTSVRAAQQLTVTSKAGELPKIENFKVEDGYADKFIIKWKYNADYAYSLKWTNIAPDGSASDGSLSGKDFKLPDADGNGAVDVGADGCVSFVHPAASGDKRKYTLTAKAKLEKSTDDTAEYRTLGTPEPVQNGIDFNTIIVDWPDVQMASGYEVLAHYADAPAVEIAAGKYTIAKKDGRQVCTIKPAGSNDQARAGKPIALTVKAKNGSKAVTEKKITVRNIGPALLQTACTAHDAKSISIRWNAFEGAAGYLIRRVMYSDAAATKVAYTDTYYYNAADKKLFANGEEAGAGRGAVAVNGKTLTLKDNYKEDESGGVKEYQKHQAEIPLGLPCGYAVIPVKEGDGDVSFGNGNDAFKAKNADGTADLYSAPLKAVVGAALGYGQDVAASKVKDAEKVFVQWKAPYHKELRATVYRKPFGAANANAAWQKVGTAEKDATKFTDETLKDADRYRAYLYAVSYSSADSTTVLFPIYEKKLAAVKETRSEYVYANDAEREEQNKGYVFALDPKDFLKAGYGGTPNADKSGFVKDDKYYSETVSWNAWNYNERKIGPSEVRVDIFNSNLKSGWMKIADLDPKNFAFKTPATLTDTVVTGSGSSLCIKPQGISAGTATNTDGALKVLRDAKHYYKLTLKRDDAEINIGAEKDVFAFRQITDEELTKAAMLAFSYTCYLKMGGKADLSNVNTPQKYGEGGKKTLTSEQNGGTAIFEWQGIYPWKTFGYAYFTFDNYAPAMITPSGVTTSFLALTIPKTEMYTQDAASNAYPTEIKETTITVAPLAAIAASDGIRLATYSAEITFACQCWRSDFWGQVTHSHKLAVKMKGGTEKVLLDGTENFDTLRTWIPFQLYTTSGLGNSEHYHIAESKYGWWVD